ncbi:hypothetical protein DL771_003543 [Monosporascus sp. 5C6A]|nr:hypothetical protein DL771_003543 [Monosporascus sp. 5C6A]
MGLLTNLGLRRPSIWERPTALDEFLDSPLQAIIFRLYLVFLSLRGVPVRPPKNRQPIKVVCISDTHDTIVANVPDGDLLIHAGDSSNDGSAASIQAQIDWLDSLPHRHKVFVCGNHDSWFDIKARSEVDALGQKAVDLKSVHYLQRKSITLAFKCGRRLNIYGAPDLPKCGPSNFAFQYPHDQHPWAGLIPHDTDILVTHTPPVINSDLATAAGAQATDEIWRKKPTVHVFGHVHWGRGKQAVFWDDCQRSYERLMSRKKRGPIYDMIPNGGWLDAIKVLFYGIRSVVWHYAMLGGASSGGVVINAAVQHGNSGKLVKEHPITIEI